MSAIDLAAFQSRPLSREPFDHVLVPGFLKAGAVPGLLADFPRVPAPGSFPTSELACGPAFAALLEEFASAEVRAAFAAKFDIDLASRPLMCTVRGRCRSRDGRIHTDSTSKIVTVLIYMNPGWGSAGGRLRLLRSADDIEDFATEVAPEAGTMVAFRCTDNAWHGHTPFEGERRSIQFNWVTGRAVVWREQWRHRLSAHIKRLRPAA
jgi:hypothetical protein